MPAWGLFTSLLSDDKEERTCLLSQCHVQVSMPCCETLSLYKRGDVLVGHEACNIIRPFSCHSSFYSDASPGGSG